MRAVVAAGIPLAVLLTLSSRLPGGHSSHQQPPVCELCSCTFAATETVVDCGRLRLYDMPRGFPANTTSLDLSYNELTGLYEGDFDGGLALLRTLNLESNVIRTVEEGVLTSLPQLATLHMDQNPSVCTASPALRCSCCCDMLSSMTFCEDYHTCSERDSSGNFVVIKCKALDDCHSPGIGCPCPHPTKSPGTLCDIHIPGYEQSRCSSDAVCTPSKVDACVTSPCSPHATGCTDHIGPEAGPSGRTCGDCAAGYDGDGNTCSDHDACSPNPCPANETCTDLPPPSTSFSCSCKPGFHRVGPTCVDGDACAVAPCSAFSQGCVDLPPPASIDISGRTCLPCRDGFSGDGVLCSDINECRPTSPCPANSSCINHPGSYECKCNPGFEAAADIANPNSSVCVDVDACTTSPCTANHTICEDLPPPAPPSAAGRTCRCAPGFSGVPGNCTAISAAGAAVQGGSSSAIAVAVGGAAACVVLLLLIVVFVRRRRSMSADMTTKPSSTQQSMRRRKQAADVLAANASGDLLTLRSLSPTKAGDPASPPQEAPTEDYEPPLTSAPAAENRPHPLSAWSKTTNDYDQSLTSAPAAHNLQQKPSQPLAAWSGAYDTTTATAAAEGDGGSVYDSVAAKPAAQPWSSEYYAVPLEDAAQGGLPPGQAAYVQVHATSSGEYSNSTDDARIMHHPAGYAALAGQHRIYDTTSSSPAALLSTADAAFLAAKAEFVHGPVSRREAEVRLATAAPGTYLIRERPPNPRPALVVSLVEAAGVVCHRLLALGDDSLWRVDGDAATARPSLAAAFAVVESDTTPLSTGLPHPDNSYNVITTPF